MKKHLLNAILLALIIPILVSIGVISVPSVLLFPIGLLIGNVIKNVLSKYLDEG